MIKKICKLFIILLLMIVPNNEVFGKIIENDNDYISLVEKFSIGNNNKISISGYAFVSKRDNYGKFKTSDFGNLITKVVAYTGKWDNNFVYSNKCNDSNRCLELGNKEINRNFYFSLCSTDGCRSEKEKELIQYRRSNPFDTEYKSEYDGAYCSSIFANVPGGGMGAHCLNSNVGFKVDVDLEKVLSSLSFADDKDTMKFKIVSYYYLDSKNYDIYYSSLNLVKEFCSVGGKNCVANSSMKVGDYEFTFNNFATEVKFLATDAFDRKYGSNQGRAGYFAPNRVYKISKVIKPMELTKFVCDSNNNCEERGTYTDALYLLESKLEKGKVCSGNTVQDCISPSTNSGSAYYASGSHLRVVGDASVGDFGISEIKPNVVSYNCDNVSDFVKNKDTAIDEKAICENNRGNNKKGDNAKFGQCKKIEKVIGEIEVAVGHNKCSGLIKNGRIKVKVSTDILLNQTAEFGYSAVTNGAVAAGKGFEVIGTYNNTISWVNANYTLSGNPYYEYSGTSYDSTCKEVNVNINDYKTYYYNNKTYTNLNALSKLVIDDSIAKRIKYNDNISFESYDSNKVSNELVDVKGSWNNIENNKKEADFKLSGSGLPSITGNGFIISNKYNYNLANAYIALINTNYDNINYYNGDILYSIDELNDDIIMTNFGGPYKKYYIPFKFTKKYFDFNVKENNPSMFEDMVWNLNGDCDIKVDNGYWCDPEIEDCDSVDPDNPVDPNDPDNPVEPNNPSGSNGNLEFLIKYRSISLNNPFPKGNIVKNWKSWWDENNNKQRIFNTYSNNPLYKIIISKLDNGTGVSIADINKVNSHYGSLEGIDSNGNSKFVFEKFTTKSNTQSFCPLGKFIADECDLVRGS